MEYKRVKPTYDGVFQSVVLFIFSLIKSICQIVFEILKLFILPLSIIFGGPKTLRFWVLYGFLFTYVMFAISSYYDPNAFLTVDFVGLFTDTYDFILNALKNIFLGVSIIFFLILGVFFIGIGAIFK